MKKLIAVMLILGEVMASLAQIPTKMFEKNKAFEKHPNFQNSRNIAPENKMPAFDVTPLLEEDEAVKDMDIPFRFGKSFDVNLGLKDGKWIKTDSTEIWSLKISSPKAYSLNFIFSDLYLPEGAELHIFNEDGSMVYGPVTEKQNQHGKTYLTDIIQGDATVIQLSVPINSIERPKLVIQNVIHGYKKIYPDPSLEDIGYGESGWCVRDEDIVCYPAWSEESDGVVQILLANGQELCSGSLLNNTAQDYRPFILTAFHCIDADKNGVLSAGEVGVAEEWLVRFRFRHRYCTDSEYIFDNVITFDDTHFRAAWHPTDFALVELQDDILRDVFSVGQKVWLGWDHTGTTPSTVTCIHHPAGDVMKYTYDGESPSITNYGGTNNSHWFVDDWDIGNTEGGSSGSPLFDQNKRVIGQDHAGDGEPICDEDKGTYFGSLSLSWDGDSTNATRLSNWLDPLGTGATTLNSVRPAPEYSGIPEQLCSSTSFSVINLPPGYSFQQWNGSNVTFSNNTSNPVQVTPGSNGAGWVEAVVNTGWGNYTMERVYFWCGPPQFSYITGPTSTPNYQWATYYVEPYDTLMGLQSNNDYSWTLNPLNGNSLYNYGRSVDIAFYNSGSYQLVVRAENDCGFGPYTMASIYVYDAKSLSITPNPANGEVTVAIESTDKNELIVSEWDLEIFSETMLLKEKKTKLKGKSTTIQTADWMEGIYMVRVKYKDEILTGKLIVKK